MAKFNQKKDKVVETVNMQGGYAIERNNKKDELVMQTVSNLVGEPDYYRSSGDGLKNYEEAIDAVLAYDPEFVLKLAVYARHILHLRTAPMFLINRYTMQENRIKGASKYIVDSIMRADDMTELAALQLNYCGCITNPVKRALAKAFLKFDEYQYSKYKGLNHNVSLRDVMFIVHPKPESKDRERIFRNIANNTLPPADTWEVKMSTGGNWSEIIPKMGIMATVRNLRNFEQAGIPVSEYEYKFTREIVRNSKMFPYRFYTAYKNVNTYDNEKLLIQAMEYAVENIPNYNGKTAILIDTSSSMTRCASSKSTIRMNEIAAFMGACIASKQHNVQFISYASGAEEIPVYAHDNIMSIVEKVSSRIGNVGHGTNVCAGLNLVDDDVERVIIMSDMQFGMFDHDIRDCKLRVPIYAFNLSSYPNCSFNKKRNLFEIGGFSDKVFDLIEAAENEKLSQIVENFHL